MSRFVCWFAVLGLAGTVVPVVRADDIYLKETGTFDREKFRLLMNEEAVSPPNQNQLAEMARGARTYVYRLTERANHKVPGEMAKAVGACEYLMKTIVYSPQTKNLPLQQAFPGQMVEALTAVLKPKDQHAITRVNAALVLARLAELSGSEETADLAVTIINNPDQVDGARYWAFRTLKNLFSRATKPISAARREKAVESLVQFIERPSKLAKDAPSEEVEGTRLVRREAIRALGTTRDPGVATKKGADAAWTLVRILNKDVEPKPRLDEQVEAAVGLCNIRPDPKGDYQPGYAVVQVGHFLIDFVAGFNSRDKLSREPWKIHAARMEEALAGLLTALPNDPAVKVVVPQAVRPLRDIQQGKQTIQADDLREALKNAPVPASLYKSNPKAVIAPRER